MSREAPTRAIARIPLAVFAWVLCGMGPGCGESTLAPMAGQILPSVGVDRFVLGRFTNSELDAGGPDERGRLSREGLDFQFDRGGPLTGVTVTSKKFSTPSGVRVGSPVAEVVAAYGAGTVGPFTLNKGSGDSDPAHPVGARDDPSVISYPGIMFIIHDEKVWAVHVGKE